MLPTALIGAAFVLVAAIFAWSSDSWYLTFKAVHVVFAVIWVGGGVMLTILGILAERQNDPVGRRQNSPAGRAGEIGEKVFDPGLDHRPCRRDRDDDEPRLGMRRLRIIFGLIGFASTFVIGIGILSPTAKKVGAMIAASGPASPEAQAMISKLLLIARLDMAVLLLVIVDMVTKPFS